MTWLLIAVACMGSAIAGFFLCALLTANKDRENEERLVRLVTQIKVSRDFLNDALKEDARHDG